MRNMVIREHFCVNANWKKRFYILIFHLLYLTSLFRFMFFKIYVILCKKKLKALKSLAYASSKFNETIELFT